MPKLELELTPDEARIIRAKLPANPNKMRGFDARTDDEQRHKAAMWKIVNALDIILHNS